MLTSPDRLRQLVDDYLGTEEDREDQEGEAASLARQVRLMRDRLTGQVASMIKAGVDGQVVKDAVAQVEEEIGLLERRQADLVRILSSRAERQQRASDLEHIAEQAAGRLGSMSLADQAEVLGLLEVRVELTEDGYRISGVVSDLGLSAEPGAIGIKVLRSHVRPPAPGNTPGPSCAQAPSDPWEWEHEACAS